MKRDATKLDPATKKPLCYGNASPRDPACLICRFSVVCREVAKMKGGAPAPVLPPLTSEDDIVADQYEDEDDDGQEA